MARANALAVYVGLREYVPQVVYAPCFVIRVLLLKGKTNTAFAALPIACFVASLSVSHVVSRHDKRCVCTQRSCPLSLTLFFVMHLSGACHKDLQKLRYAIEQVRRNTVFETQDSIDERIRAAIKCQKARSPSEVHCCCLLFWLLACYRLLSL